MKSSELRENFLAFFKGKGHEIIPSASLVPENDPTVLFTTAGMHPLVPFLLGEKHPSGKRLANVQICIRTDDIDEVGDDVHHTFFEMLGNWSLGDYFKEEAIKMSFEFLTDSKWLGLKKDRIAVSIFAGDKDAPQDEESEKIWLSLGIPQKRIKKLGKKDNWWGPAGETGPCGPDTEIFYWSGKEKAPEKFDSEDKRWIEIWNDVFMQYFKSLDGKYELLSQKNVDTGMGLERILSAIGSLGDDYKTDVFWPIIKELEDLSGKKYEDNKKEFRIISDHIKAATFITGDRKGVEPSNVGQGYVVRKLIRRAIRYGRILKLSGDFLIPLIEKVLEIYSDSYPYLKAKEDYIIDVVKKEGEKFEKTLEQGLREFKIKAEKNEGKVIPGKVIFDLYQSYGFPFELTEEMAKEKGLSLDKKGFKEEFRGHQELSRTASAGMFKGGLADTGEKAVKYHTATHLLLAALRQVLGEYVYQRGSNINAERLRFDFSHPQKMTEDEIKKVEELVNEKIKENIPVVCREMSLEEARKKGMMGIFESKYGEKVKTYMIEEFSKEICGGPHVKETGELGNFKILKEESSGAGIRRIKAVLNP
ncbi:MAG: alanine--tRNA ligase [Candidatus Pacebacteria bacterium]|nr:alanine--tRNA ligase [Candidatus Paceibacterota bacterium]